jgi:hypothetical protein
LRAAEVLAKYAKEFVPSKKGMVEAGLAAVAFEWLKEHVWAAEPEHPPPHTDPPQPPAATTAPHYDFGAARGRACREPSLGRDMALFLGCPGQPLHLLKLGDIDLKFDSGRHPDLFDERDGVLRAVKCRDAPLEKMSACMAFWTPR